VHYIKTQVNVKSNLLLVKERYGQTACCQTVIITDGVVFRKLLQEIKKAKLNQQEIKNQVEIVAFTQGLYQ
jgi:hypothetical protein